jgi:hypothetical protein
MKSSLSRLRIKEISLSMLLIIFTNCPDCIVNDKHSAIVAGSERQNELFTITVSTKGVKFSEKM